MPLLCFTFLNSQNVFTFTAGLFLCVGFYVLLKLSCFFRFLSHINVDEVEYINYELCVGKILGKKEPEKTEICTETFILVFCCSLDLKVVLIHSEL